VILARLEIERYCESIRGFAVKAENGVPGEERQPIQILERKE
jgi:hypothetical protein